MRRLAPIAVVVLALLAPASASGATLVGSDLSPTPNANAGQTVTLVQTVKRNTSSVQPAASAGGVLVSLKFGHGPIASGNHGFAFRILNGTYPNFTARPASPDGSTANTVTIDGADNPGIETYAPKDAAGDPVGIPIAVGERIALVAPGDVSVFASNAIGGDFAFRTGSHDSGAQPYSDGANNFEVLVQGTIEPDADGDKYGDETQDSCTTDATVHKGPCPADVSITKTADRATATTGDLIDYTIRVTNENSTASATGVTVTDTLPAGATVHFMSANQGTCSGTTTVTCAIGTIGPKATRTVQIVIRTGQPGVTTNTATVASENDSSAANNAASATTNVTDPPPPPDTTAPVLGSVKISNKKFAVNTKGAAEPLVKAAKRKRPKKGTKFTYTLDEPGEVRFVISQKVPGYLLRPGTCVGTSRPIPRNKKCTRLIERGRFVQAGVVGANSKKWSGRLGTKTPPPGNYQATITAVDAAGNRSKLPVVLNFTIVKP